MITESKPLENGVVVHKNLKVWEMAHELTSQIYHVTNLFPEKEQFRLTSNMRRAALCLPDNIVEGKSRNSQKEFKHYLSIARGSVDKLNYFLLLSRGLNYIDSNQYDELDDKCSHIGSMLNNLINRCITSKN